MTKKMTNIKKQKPEFDINDRGYRVRAWYIEDGEGDTLIEIQKEGKIYKEFKYPFYKIWNIAAHFSDIVDGELEGSDVGYSIAGSNGLGGAVMPEKSATKTYGIEDDIEEHQFNIPIKIIIPEGRNDENIQNSRIRKRN